MELKTADFLWILQWNPARVLRWMFLRKLRTWKDSAFSPTAPWSSKQEKTAAGVNVLLPADGCSRSQHRKAHITVNQGKWMDFFSLPASCYQWVLLWLQKWVWVKVRHFISHDSSEVPFLWMAEPWKKLLDCRETGGSEGIEMFWVAYWMSNNERFACRCMGCSLVSLEKKYTLVLYDSFLEDFFIYGRKSIFWLIFKVTLDNSLNFNKMRISSLDITNKLIRKTIFKLKTHHVSSRYFCNFP